MCVVMVGLFYLRALRPPAGEGRAAAPYLGSSTVGLGVQVAQVVLLEPAARVAGVPVRRAVEGSAHVSAGSLEEQLLAARVEVHEGGQIVEAATGEHQAGAPRAALLHLAPAVTAGRDRRSHGWTTRDSGFCPRTCCSSSSAYV